MNPTTILGIALLAFGAMYALAVAAGMKEREDE